MLVLITIGQNNKNTNNEITKMVGKNMNSAEQLLWANAVFITNYYALDTVNRSLLNSLI